MIHRRIRKSTCKLLQIQHESAREAGSSDGYGLDRFTATPEWQREISGNGQF